MSHNRKRAAPTDVMAMVREHWRKMEVDLFRRFGRGGPLPERLRRTKKAKP